MATTLVMAADGWPSAALCDPAHAVLRSCVVLSSSLCLSALGAAAENPETATPSPAAHVQAPPAPETVGRNRAQAESEYGTDVFCRVILPVLFQSGAGQGFSCAGLRLLMLAVMMTMAMAMGRERKWGRLLAHPNATLWAILRPRLGPEVAFSGRSSLCARRKRQSQAGAAV